MNTLSFNDIAYAIGTHTRMTDEALAPVRAQYAKGTPEQQADLRQRWMVYHMAGALDITADKAREKFSLGKGKGAKASDIKAIDRAYSDFRYYMITKAKTKPSTESHARVSKAHREAAMAFLGEFEGESLDKQIDAAIAVLRALKK
jgi:hypothetical protein